MKIEIFIYLILAAILCAVRRAISGAKNGCFYAKGNKYPTPLLDDYIKNIHYLETPAWYSQFGAFFLVVFAVFRLVDYNYEFLMILKQFTAAMIVTMGSSGIASYHFQAFINHGCNLPLVDPNENPKSEFAFGPIKFWWNRPWCGKRRKWIPFVAFISVVLGLLLGLNII